MADHLSASPAPAVDSGVNSSPERRIGQIVAARLSRRQALRGLAATAVAGGLASTAAGTPAQAQGGSTLTFAEIAHGLSPDHLVARGYTAQVLIRWGDKVVGGAPSFDPLRQTAAAQLQQFGYNNDYV